MKIRFGGLAAAATVLATCATAVAATGTADSSLPTVNVTMTGKTVSMPKTIKSGATTFSVTTTGEKESVLTIVRLDPGVTVPEVFKRVQAAHGDPNAIIGYASIITSYASPAGPTPGTVSTVLAPGRYAALDFAANGQPPTTTFTVTKSSQSMTLPKPAATIKEIEFAFQGPSTLHDGELVRFENDGYVTHMAVAAEFSSRATAVKAMGLLKAGNDHAAEKLAGGFADFFDANSPGALQQETVSAAPGWYVMACFMATGDGREHTTLGMLKLVRVTR